MAARVLIRVDGGIAEVVAVTGDVEIAIVDVDREGADLLTKEEADAMVQPCSPSVFECCTDSEFDQVCAYVRNALDKYVINQ